MMLCFTKSLAFRLKDICQVLFNHVLFYLLWISAKALTF